MTEQMAQEAELGTCRACGQELIKYNGDIWHPHTVERHCSAAPITMRPGEENFIPNAKPVCSWCEEELKPGERFVPWLVKDGVGAITDKGVFHLRHLYTFEGEGDEPSES